MLYISRVRRHMWGKRQIERDRTTDRHIRVINAHTEDEISLYLGGKTKGLGCWRVLKKILPFGRLLYNHRCCLFSSEQEVPPCWSCQVLLDLYLELHQVYVPNSLRLRFANLLWIPFLSIETGAWCHHRSKLLWKHLSSPLHQNYHNLVHCQTLQAHALSMPFASCF